MTFVIFVSSLLLVRRKFYELSIELHHELSLGFLVLLWYHQPIRRDIPTVCISTASAFSIVRHLFWLVRLVWQNGLSGDRYEYGIEHLDSSAGTHGATKITIVGGTWKFSPGQYVYTRARNLGPQYWYGMLESHPYIVAWMEHDQSNASEQRRFVLVAERHNGFSEKLGIANVRRGFKRNIVVDGPYGMVPALDKHDITVFAASGIGLVARLLPIKRLIEKYESRDSQTRRILLVWILEAECRPPGSLATSHR